MIAHDKIEVNLNNAVENHLKNGHGKYKNVWASSLYSTFHLKISLN